MKIVCPNCGCDELGVVESLTAIAMIGEILPDGTIEYGGGSQMAYNDQFKVTNAAGHVKLHCYRCDLEWYEAQLHAPVNVYTTPVIP